MFSINFLMKSMPLLIIHVYMIMNFEKKTFSIFNYYRKNNNNLRDWDVLTFCIATKLRHEKNSNTRISSMAFRLVNLNIRQPVIYDQSNIKKLYILFYVSWQGEDTTTFRMPLYQNNTSYNAYACRLSTKILEKKLSFKRTNKSIILGAYF